MESLGVAPLPRRTGPSQTVMYESGFGIGSTCRHPELAWKYIKFMTSYKVQRRYNATGIAVCGRKDVSAEQAAKSALERDFLAIVPSCRAPWGTKIIGYDLIEDTGQRAMDSIMKNGVEPSVALRAAADEIDQALERL